MNEAKKIETGNLRIEKNIIAVENILLQISNISQVSIEPVPKKKINPFVIIELILGILAITQPDDNVKAFGILFIIIAIAYFVWICYTNLDSGQYLHYI